MNILITGGSGYIGGMLADIYAQNKEVEQVICIDKDPRPEWLEVHSNISWVQANLAYNNWEKELPAGVSITHVVHAAWQIRDWYGGRETVREWNLEGSRRVFDFAFTTPSVERLVYFSSISQFGATSYNTITKRFTETSPTRITGYCYADDKYEADHLLEHMYHQYESALPLMVIKPSTVTGPRGRIGVGKFSLAAALSADANKQAIPRVVQWMLSFMPVIGRWTRQFVHEDDIAKAVALGLESDKLEAGIHEYIVSPFDVIDGRTMAELTDKKAVPIPAWVARIGFFVLWHGTRGRIPTAPGVWRFMAYPICVDGSKIEEELGYQYQYSSRKAISTLEGRYAPKQSSN